MANTRPLYVIASELGASTLKIALRRRHLPDGEVCGFSHGMLAVGPLELVDKPDDHLAWVRAHVPSFVPYTSGEPERTVHDNREAWSKLDAWDGPVVFVYSSTEVEERSLFLALARRSERLGRIAIADLAEQHRGAVCSGECTPHVLANAAARARPAPSAVELGVRANLARLSEGPTALRMFDGGELCHAAFDAHDERIMEFVTEDWTPGGDLIRTIIHDSIARGGRDPSFAVLIWRFHQLAAQGRIERRGASDEPLWDDAPWKGEVRRTRGPPARPLR